MISHGELGEALAVLRDSPPLAGIDEQERLRLVALAQSGLGMRGDALRTAETQKLDTRERHAP
jgi:hypothetical protein